MSLGMCTHTYHFGSSAPAVLSHLCGSLLLQGHGAHRLGWRLARGLELITGYLLCQVSHFLEAAGSSSQHPWQQGKGFGHTALVMRLLASVCRPLHRHTVCVASAALSGDRPRRLFIVVCSISWDGLLPSRIRTQECCHWRALHI